MPILEVIVLGETLTAEAIGQTLYPRTAAEITASVIPVKYQYPPGDIRRHASGGDGLTFATRWTGWEASASALLSLAEPFGKYIRAPAGRYGISTQINPSGGGTFEGDGSGSTAMYVTSTSLTPFATTYLSEGHQHLVFCGFTLAGPGVTSTGTGISLINTFQSLFEDLYVTGFNYGVDMNTTGPTSTSCHSNKFAHCRIISNNLVNIRGQNGANALALDSVVFGGGPVQKGLEWVESVSLDIYGASGCEGAAVCAVDIYSTSGRLAVGARIKAHFEANASTGGDIRIGQNGGSNVPEGISVTGSSFVGNGSTHSPMNVVRGQGIEFCGNSLAGSYTNAAPVIDPSVTDYVQLANRPGDLCPDRLIGESRDFSRQNQTNKGVHSLGGGSATSGKVSVTDNQTFTITFDHAAILLVHDFTSGVAASFLVSYASATIVEMGDPSGLWSVTDADTNPGFAIFKSAASNVVSIKNYMNSTRSMAVNVFGCVTAATAPA